MSPKITQSDKKVLSLYLLSFALFLLVIPKVNKSIHKPKLIIDPQNEVVNIAPSIIKVLSLGQTRLIASSLWVETMLRSDYKHHQDPNVENWMYLRFNSITELAPLFFEVYFYGGMYLSIIKDDDLGAQKIFDKGLIKFPNSYPLLFQAGFHYFSELQNYPKAISIFEQAMWKEGMHPFLPSLLARIKSNAGNLSGAQELLEFRLKSLPEDSKPEVINRLKNSIYAVKAEIDIACLNKQLSSCNQYDYFGKPYIIKQGTYRAQKRWKPFRLKNKKSNNPD